MTMQGSRRDFHGRRDSHIEREMMAATARKRSKKITPMSSSF